MGHYATRQGTYVEYECRVTASGSLIRVPPFLATVQIPRWISIEIDLDPPTWLVPGSTSNVEPGTTTTYVLVVLSLRAVRAWYYHYISIGSARLYSNVIHSEN